MRGFVREPAGKAVAVLCLLILSMIVLPLAADEAPAITRMIAVDNDAWQSDLIASEAIGETHIEFADYPIGPRPGVLMPDGGSAVYKSFGTYSGPGPVRVVRLATKAGAAKLHTQATFRDAAGDFNTVTIPALGVQLQPDKPNELLEFQRVENTDERSTWFALLTTAPALVSFYVYDGDNQQVGSESILVDPGYRFYELATPISIGRVELKCGVHGSSFGGCEAPVDAVAFVGYRSGGGPRVEMPSLEVTE
jgi:hypothetical protein